MIVLIASLLQDDKMVPVEGQIVSSQTITSKSRTVETTTYAIEQEGGTETHIEQKVSTVFLLYYISGKIVYFSPSFAVSPDLKMVSFL
jgi:ABC-type Na+ efflux pump permease subunit